MTTPRRARKLLLCAMAAVLAGVPMVAVPSAPAAAATGQWEDVGSPMALARQNFGATPGPCPGTPLTSERRCIYAIGGLTNLSTPPPAGVAGEVYDTGTGAWSPLPAMALAPGGRPQSAAVTGGDGKIYAFGQNLYEWMSVERFNPQTQAWEVVAPLPTPRYYLEAVADSAGRIYAIGGYAYAASAEVFMFDPANETAGWVPRASMTTPRSQFGAAFNPVDGRIYAVGGSTGDSDSAEAYVPATDSWSPIAALPEGRQQLTAAADGWGQVWVAGGYLFDGDTPTAQRYKNDTFVYDPGTNQWKAGPLLNVRRQNAAAATASGGELLVIGGSSGSGGALRSAEALDPPDLDFLPWVDPPSSPDTWVPGRPMTWTRAYHAATSGPCPEPAVASCVYAIGGSIQSSNTATDSSEAFNLAAKDWAPVPRMAVSRRSHAAVTDSQGRIYAIGGVGANYAYLNTVERFDPAGPGAGWTAVAPMNLPRANLAAVTASNGKIYAIGGQAGAGHQTMEVYDPTADSWTLLTATMSVARSGLVAATSGDLIYAIGGPSPYNTVEVYSITAGTWTIGVPLTTGRRNAAAAVGTDGRIYAIGGQGDTGTDRSVEVFDPREAEPVWRPAAPTIAARYAAAATTAPDGRIFLLGGYGNSGNLSSIEVYTPGPARDVVGPGEPEPIVSPNFVERRTDKEPISIARDPDGNLWFTAQGSIGRMTPDGKFQHWPAAASAYGADITLGPDGFMWFTGPQSNTIGKIDRSTGQITEYPLPPTLTSLSTFVGSGPQKIVAGPDGALWFTHAGANRIGRITTGGQVTDYLVPTPQAGLKGITVGPDGNIWFIESSAVKLGRITPSGQITEYAYGPPPATPQPFPSGGALDIVTWQGKVWFTLPGTNNGKVGELTPSAPDPAASVRTYDLKHGEEDDDYTRPVNMAVGPDGNLWVTDANGLSGVYWPERHYLVRISPMAPTVKVDAFMLPLTTEYEGEPSTGTVGDITADAPYLAFTESDPSTIGRFDPRGATPTFSYRPGVATTLPGENCVSSGDPAANEAKTRTKSCTMASAGPLSHVIVSPWLNCQVWHVDDTAGEHYVDGGEMPRDRAGDGECGTFLVADGEWYGPQNVPCFYWYREEERPPRKEADGCANTIYDHNAPETRPTRYPDHFFELIEQRGVFGTGTTKDPYRIETKVRAGKMVITQTDSYIVGRQTYRTDVAVTNTGDTTSDLLLTRAGDCWLNNSDAGGGRYTPATGAVACTADAGTVKGSMYTDPVEGIQSQMIEWTPITPGSNWAVGDRVGIWHLVGYKEPFPDSCVDGGSNAFDPNSYVGYVTGQTAGGKTEPGGAEECSGENGAGLSWSFNLAPGESATKSHYTTFSPYGNTVASIEDAAPVTEPATGLVSSAFIVNLAHPSGRPVTLEYTAVDGSAKGEEDYVPTTGRVEFKPGELSKTVTVPVKGDGQPEEAEDFKVVISDPDDKIVDDPLVNDLGRPDVNPDSPGGSGFVNSQTVLIDRGEATGLIDDNPPPSLSIEDAPEVAEPADATATATFTVRRSGEPTRPLAVRYATVDGGSAQAGVDYEATEGTLEFAPDELIKEIPVTVLADGQAGEPNEDFFVELFDSPDAALGTFRARGTIADPAVELSVSDTSVVESRSGPVTAVFTVRLAAPTSQATSFDYATADGSATAPADFTAATGRLEIPAGETSVTIAVEVMGDTETEGTEEFSVALSSPVGATLGKGRGTATILDAAAAAPGSLSIGDAGVDEGDSATHPAVFTVSLADAHTEVVTVGYATVDDTATAGDDYRPATGTLTFAPGDVSETVTVAVVGDTAVEPTERFTVTLTNATGAPIAGSQGTGTIRDDDVEPAVGDESTPAAATTQPPPVRASDPTPGPGTPPVAVPVTPALVVPPLLVLAPMPPVPVPPQPITQPMTQAQAQQQAQQQNQQQQQQQQQQQAQQQAQSQAQSQAQGQVQTQAGMAAERQKETQVERAYASSTDKSAQTNLATALNSSRPATGPVLGFIAAMMAAGMGLLSRNGSSGSPAHQRVRSGQPLTRGRQKRRNTPLR